MFYNFIMKKKVFAYLHTHWDREWYREFEEFHLRLVEVFDDVLQKLENNEIPSFYFDGQTAALEDYLQIKPEKQEQIKQLIKEKRLFIGPYYCSTDSFLIDSESLIKNLQLGIKYAKTMGCNEFVAYHADTFGHSKFIPQIIKYFDIPYAIFWRGLGELNSEFLFSGLKSTYLVEGYFHDYLSAKVDYDKKAEFFKRTLDRIAKYSSNNLLLPLGADHLALADNIKEQLSEINKRLSDYEIILSTPFEYYTAVQKNFKSNIEHEFRDTKRNFILPGVWSSRIDLKQQNTLQQWQISRVLQPLNALYAVKNFQPQIDYLHKELIKNHPHDSIYGCSVDNVHRSNMSRYAQVAQGSNAVLNSIKRDLFDENALSVINLSNYAFNGALSIKTDKKLTKQFKAQLVTKTKGFPLTRLYRTNETPITEDYTDIYEYLVDVKEIKPLSSKKLSINDISADSSLKITENSIENECIALSVKNGKIVVKNKLNGKVCKDFIKFIDRGDAGDSYNFGPVVKDKPINSHIIKTRIKEKDTIRSILEMTFGLDVPVSSNIYGRNKKVKKHTVKTEVILENNSQYLQFKVNWINKCEDHLLQIEFNMDNPVTQTYSDDLAGYIKRDFDPDYDIYKLIPAPRGVELKHNTAPLQKSLWVQGVGVITKGLQEYEVYKNKLRLTILRATGVISNPQNPSRGTPAGPPLPTPDLQMLGQNSVEFALMFSDSIEQMQPSVEKFFGAALLLNANLQDKTFFEIQNENIVVSTIKTDIDNNLIVRLLNVSEKSQMLNINFNIDYSKIYFTDAMEQKIKEFTACKIAANSFITLLIEK